MSSAVNNINQIEEYLGSGARELLDYKANGIPKETLHLPGPDWVDRIYLGSDRPTPVLRSLQSLLNNGRLVQLGKTIIHCSQDYTHCNGDGKHQGCQISSFTPGKPYHFLQLAILILH